MKKILFIFFTFLLLPSYLASAQEEARLMRFPSIHGEKIVFSYAGDLYLVSAEGGIARKITSDVGYEMFPKFSPDGSQIAFTGQYDGNTEVYLIPAEGGVPQRLTYTATLDRDIISDRMGPNNIVMSWTPDGKNITYRSRKESFNSFKGALFNVTVDGGLSTQLPLADGGFCSYSPDGKKLAFNKIFREFRTWKYYRGGMADDIRIFDFDTKEITDITNNKAQDIEPMWAGNEIYFLSDRERTMNLFVYNTDTKETTQVTNFTDYDIKFPSIGKSNLVFEKGGYIYKVNLKTKQVEKVNIEIDNDFIYARQELKDASKEIRDADISPNGERVVFSARGDVYTVPAKEGVTYNLTQTSGVHERDATWSPDGKYIAWIADNTGEFEIYIQKQDGSEPPVQLTSGADTYKFTAIWSPDSKKLLWGDQKFRLRYIDIDSKKVTLVKQAKNSRINDYNWSPDSKWIAYTDLADNNMSVVDVYNLDTKETHVITSEWFDNSNPSFSDDGKYIVFSSGRNFSPTYSQIEWNYAYLNMSSLYMIPLLKSTPSPFAPENDMVKTEEPEKESSDKKGKDKKEEKTEGVQVNIDFDGITDRTISIPVEPSNYFNPQMIGNKIYYYDYSRGNGGLTAKVYDLKKKEETELGSGIRYVISANHKKMLVREHGKYAVIDLPSGKISLKETMDLSNMKVMVDYAKEWKQIFNESWRQMRDFFYVSNMHGLDWKAIHDKYAVLVPYVKQRDDLTYIIGEMIGELSIGHAYVESGDRPEVKKIKTGLLGAQLTKDPSGF
ncbi:MAG TPA: protease, partial [Bacteroidales bacterium]|nr:protease [Bacteroidales bacterium]